MTNQVRISVKFVYVHFVRNAFKKSRNAILSIAFFYIVKYFNMTRCLMEKESVRKLFSHKLILLTKAVTRKLLLSLSTFTIITRNICKIDKLYINIKRGWLWKKKRLCVLAKYLSLSLYVSFITDSNLSCLLAILFLFCRNQSIPWTFVVPNKKTLMKRHQIIWS